MYVARLSSRRDLGLWFHLIQYILIFVFVFWSSLYPTCQLIPTVYPSSCVLNVLFLTAIGLSGVTVIGSSAILL